jgi:hypothetical protein
MKVSKIRRLGIHRGFMSTRFAFASFLALSVSALAIAQSGQSSSQLVLTRTTGNRLLACGRAAAEADDVAIRVLDIEVLRAPLGRRDRLDNRHAVGDALLVERLNAINARRGVEMIVVAPVLAVGVVLGCFLQVKFESIQNTDRVEPFPWLAEREAHLLVVRDRALKVIDKELWSKRCHTRLYRSHRPPFSASNDRILSAVSPRVKMPVGSAPAFVVRAFLLDSAASADSPYMTR